MVFNNLLIFFFFISLNEIILKIISNLFPTKNNLINNIYIHGKVGRGKSMLMQNFYNNLSINNKLYLHFSDFMQKIHEEMHVIRSYTSFSKDKLVEIAIKNIVKKNIVICLDEFQVDDVTDAMILKKIISYLFKGNIFMVFTSNSKPEDLYQNILQRQSFLDFINGIFKPNCIIFNLDSDTDYRRGFLRKVKQHYFFPINQENNTKILSILHRLTNKNKLNKEEIEITRNRKIFINKSYKNIALFNFKELFLNAMGSKDYKYICNKYNIIFLLNIPKLSPDDRNEAKRLILFIDQAYEAKISLLILSEVDIDEIYKKGVDSFKFKRTASRLKEMMSDDYGKLIMLNNDKNL